MTEAHSITLAGSRYGQLDALGMKYHLQTHQVVYKLLDFLDEPGVRKQFLQFMERR